MPLQNHSSGHLGGRSTLWSAEEMLERQRQRADIPVHAKTAHNGLPHKRLDENLRRIVPHDPPLLLKRPNRARDWTELIFLFVCFLFCFPCLHIRLMLPHVYVAPTEVRSTRLLQRKADWHLPVPNRCHVQWMSGRHPLLRESLCGKSVWLFSFFFFLFLFFSCFGGRDGGGQHAIYSLVQRKRRKEMGRGWICIDALFSSSSFFFFFFFFFLFSFSFFFFFLVVGLLL